PAVVLGDDGILRHIHQAPREVAGVGRLERRVGEALAGPVRGDEVLQDGEALAEVRRDGGLDDLAGGLRHQAAHARQLADLLRGAAGAGVGHDEDRVEARLLLLLAVPLHHSVPISPIISPATCSVTCAQMSITLLYRSPSVIRPSRYWFSISATSF